MADIWEERGELIEPRLRLFKLIDATPHLDWLVLTKRPENWRSLTIAGFDGDRQWGQVVPTRRDVVRPNVWAGVSVESQEHDYRISRLVAIPAAIHFLSLEPLLGPVSLRKWIGWQFGTQMGSWFDWVIVGGESGPKARPCDLAWIRAIRDQCQDAGVAVFIKQLGPRRSRTDGRSSWMTPRAATGMSGPTIFAYGNSRGSPPALHLAQTGRHRDRAPSPDRSRGV